MAVEGLRVATVAVLLVLLAAALVALRLRPREGPAVPQGLWSHVEELRRRILVVAAAGLAGIVAALTLRMETVRGWPVPRLGIYDALAAQLFAVVARDLVPPGVTLVATSPLDGFLAQMDMALGIGLLVALPVLLDQGARFLSPALRDAERRWLRNAIVPCAALFVAGAAFAYFAVLPVTLRALYGFTDALGAVGLLNVRELGAFALGFMAGFGLAFQAPLVMVALARVGLVDPAAYWRYWRHAVVVLLVVAMVVTPDPTVVSQLMLAVPLTLLYVLGAALAGRGRKTAPA